MGRIPGGFAEDQFAPLFLQHSVHLSRGVCRRENKYLGRCVDADAHAIVTCEVAILHPLFSRGHHQFPIGIGIPVGRKLWHTARSDSRDNDDMRGYARGRETLPDGGHLQESPGIFLHNNLPLPSGEGWGEGVPRFGKGPSPPVKASPSGRGGQERGIRGASGLAEILAKPAKDFVPPINCGLLPVARTIHREEAVTGIVIHVELVGLPKPFEFLFGFRYISGEGRRSSLPNSPSKGHRRSFV